MILALVDDGNRILQHKLKIIKMAIQITELGSGLVWGLHMVQNINSNIFSKNTYLDLKFPEKAIFLIKQIQKSLFIKSKYQLGFWYFDLKYYTFYISKNSKLVAFEAEKWDFAVDSNLTTVHYSGRLHIEEVDLILSYWYCV